MPVEERDMIPKKAKKEIIKYVMFTDAMKGNKAEKRTESDNGQM